MSDYPLWRGQRMLPAAPLTAYLRHRMIRRLEPKKTAGHNIETDPVLTLTGLLSELTGIAPRRIWGYMHGDRISEVAADRILSALGDHLADVYPDYWDW